jgi:hypothetical protein
LTRLLSHRSHPALRLQYLGQRHRSRGRCRARRHPQRDADPRAQVRRHPSLSCQRPLTRLTTHLRTPPPQSRAQQSRSRRRSRACRGSQGQLDAAIAQVSRPPLEPAPECSHFCQRPLTRLLSRSTHLAHPLQSRWQRDRRQGRLGARCHPQGDADHQAQVRRHPRVFAFVSAPHDKAASSHHPRSAPHPQSRCQRHRRRGRLRARCHPQGDADHKSQVRRRPIAFAFLSAPVDTPTLSPFPSCSSVTALRGTTSEPRAPPRSLPSSMRHGSPSLSARHPECSLPCQRPLTRLTTHH